VTSTRIEDDPLRADEIQAEAAHGRQGVTYLLAVIACHSDILLPLATIRIGADPADPGARVGLAMKDGAVSEQPARAEGDRLFHCP